MTVDNGERTYCVQLDPVSGSWPPVIRLKADKLAKKAGPGQLVFTLGEEEVGEITAKVAAWWICEETE